MNSPSNKSRLLAISLLLGVFVLGMLTGMGAGILALRARVRATLAAPLTAKGPMDRFMGQLRQRLTDELKLTPEEQAALQEELARAARDMKSSRATFIGDIQRIARELESRVSQKIAPEKRQPIHDKLQSQLHFWGVDFNQPSEAGSATLQSPAPEKESVR